jgi:hypothetical protein
MPAFDPNARNDHRLDSIPADAPSNDFQVNDSYYDHTDADSDINCIFPLDRLRELGEIGQVAPRLWSGFMGRIYNRTKIVEESGPKICRRATGGQRRYPAGRTLVTARPPDRGSGLSTARGARNRDDLCCNRS